MKQAVELNWDDLCTIVRKELGMPNAKLQLFARPVDRQLTDVVIRVVGEAPVETQAETPHFSTPPMT